MNIIWFSEIKWNYLWTRKQNLLSNFPATDRILFFQPFSFKGKNHFFPKRDGNVTYVTLPVYRRSIPLFTKLFNHQFFRGFFYKVIDYWASLWTRIILSTSIDTICISNIFYLPIIKKFSSIKVWDYNDHPTQFGPQPKWAMDLFNEFISDKKNLLVSSSLGLSELLRDNYNRPVIYIPNGVDLKLFNKSISTKRLKSKNIIGYVGIISSWFFDFELVKKISESFPEDEIHIYGPHSKKVNNRIVALKKLPNVKFFGSQPYEKLPSIMTSFSVGIIPLRSKPEVWRLASGKFLQYKAVGIPIVSVWLKQYSDFKENVYFCMTHKDFITNIKLAKKRSKPQRRIDLEKYSWLKLATNFRNELLMKSS